MSGRSLFQSSLDRGLLVLRAGLGATALLSPVALLVTVGYRTRPAAALGAAGWAVVLARDLITGAPWYSLPVRAALQVILCSGLALLGPGGFSIDARREARANG